MTPKQQDKLASLMLEDLRGILKAEVDENLRNIQSLKSTSIYNDHFFDSYNYTLNSKHKSVIKDHSIDYGVLSPTEIESGQLKTIDGGTRIFEYSPDPMPWKTQIRDWFSWLRCELGL